MANIDRFLLTGHVVDFLIPTTMPIYLFFGINGDEERQTTAGPPFDKFPFPFETLFGLVPRVNAAFYDDEPRNFNNVIQKGHLGGTEDILHQYDDNSITAIVIDYGVISFMNKELVKNTMKEMLRVLKLGGKVYFSDLQVSSQVNSHINSEFRKENLDTYLLDGIHNFDSNLVKGEVADPVAAIMQKWVLERSNGRQGNDVVVFTKIRIPRWFVVDVDDILDF